MPAAVWVQALGLATPESSPAVVVGTDTSRYIFNVGEGLQRFSMEHRVRLVKAEGFFFTSIGTETLGGLPGMLLTLADMGKKSVRIAGGPGLTDYLYATRQFMRRGDVSMDLLEIARPSSADKSALPVTLAFPDVTVEPVLHSIADESAIPRAAVADELTSFYDSYLTGSARLAGRFASSSAAASDGDNVAGFARAADSSDGVARTDLQGPFNPLAVGWWPWTAGTKAGAGDAAAGGETLGHITPTPLPTICAPAADHRSGGVHAVSYIVTTPPITGRFHVDAAKALGLPAGPAFGQLQRGNPVDADIPVDIALAKGLISAEQADAARSAFAATVAAHTAAAAAPAEPTPVAEAGSSSSNDQPPAAKRRKGETGAGNGVGRGKAPTGPSVRVRIIPSMVKDEDVPGQTVVIAACPSRAFISGVVDAPQLARFYAAAEGGASAGVSTPQQQQLRAVYHLCPPAVAADPAYQAWLAHFHPSVCHVFTCAPPAAAGGAAAGAGAPSPLVSQPFMHCAQAHQICKVHTLHPSAFPLPHPLPQLLQTAAAPAEDGDARSPLQRVAARMLLDEGSSAGRLFAPPPSCTPLPLGADGRRVIHALPLHRLTLIPLPPAGSDEWLGVSGSAPSVDPASALREMLCDDDMSEHLRGTLGGPQQRRQTADAPSPSFEAAVAGSSSSPGMASEDGPAPDDGVSTPISAVGPDVPGDLAVTFTGTSSAVPSKYRNVSGIYVQLPRSVMSAPAPALLLDCGEGTFGQLTRRFGVPGSASGTLNAPEDPPHADAAVVALRLVWISHMHADHHLGLPRIIAQRARAMAEAGDDPRSRPLLVVGPTRLYQWLSEFACVEPGLLGTWAFADAEHFKVFIDQPLEAQKPAATPLPPAVVSPSVIPTASDCAHGEAGGNMCGGAGDDAMALDGDETVPTPVVAAGASGEEGALLEPAPLVQVPVVAPPGSSGFFYPRDFHVPLALPTSGGAASSPAPAQFHHRASATLVAGVLAECGIARLAAIYVVHCHRAYALRLDCASLTVSPSSIPAEDAVSSGWSVVYSGDTRPCAQVIALGRGDVRPARAGNFADVPPSSLSSSRPLASAALRSSCSLLIHEATFEDSEEGCANAVEKRHSTACEALAVADAIPARHTLLTHFSARYPKLPVLKSSALASSEVASAAAAAAAMGEGEEVAPSGVPAPVAPSDPRRSVFVAYDLMTARGRDLMGLPRLLPPLHLLYRDEAASAEGEDAAEDA